MAFSACRSTPPDNARVPDRRNVLGGCSISANPKVADQAAAKFYQMLDTGQFQAIYDEASDALKKASTEQKSVAFSRPSIASSETRNRRVKWAGTSHLKSF
jgi:hypothetical protein